MRVTKKLLEQQIQELNNFLGLPASGPGSYDLYSAYGNYSLVLRQDHGGFIEVFGLTAARSLSEQIAAFNRGLSLGMEIGKNEQDTN